MECTRFSNLTCSLISLIFGQCVTSFFNRVTLYALMKKCNYKLAKWYTIKRLIITRQKDTQQKVHF